MHNLKAMNRLDLTKRVVAQLKHDEAVIGGIGNTNFDLWAAGQRPQNFYMLGSMGLAIPIALGVAIAQPDRHVDRARRRRLAADGVRLSRHGRGAGAQESDHRSLWDNGLYQITGSQPTASQSTADLVAIARGAGLANSNWAADEDEFERMFAQALKGGGPTLIAARIDGKPGVGKTDRDPVQIRVNFMRGVGAKT